MRFLLTILLLPCALLSFPAIAQKSKSKKDKEKVEEKGPRIFETIGDSLRTDSVVYYKTEIGYVMPDLSPKFKGKWYVNVMRRQAKAIPDSLVESYLEFNGDTVFNAHVGCNNLTGYYIIKGPTIKFTVTKTDTLSGNCSLNEVEPWFAKLMQERVSYFLVNDKTLQLKDVAQNVVFDCVKRKEEENKGPSSQK